MNEGSDYIKKSLIRFLGYFFYIILIGYIVFRGTEYQKYLEKIKLQTFNAFPEFIFMAIFSIAIGVLLAIPNLYTNLKKPGEWSLDWIKLTAIGLPTLYIAIFPTKYFLSIGKYIPDTIGNIMLMHSLFPQSLSGVIFGYSLVSAIAKR